MADYKLSHTAAEIDDKLSKVQDGGTGYTEDETIHPIDPKYLPGVCLPVVELSTDFIAELSESSGYMDCPDDLASALDAVKALYSPCIFRLIDPESGDFFAHVASATTDSSTGYLIYDAGTMVGIRFGFVYMDGAWIATKGA